MGSLKPPTSSTLSEMNEEEVRAYSLNGMGILGKVFVSMDHMVARALVTIVGLCVFIVFTTFLLPFSYIG